MELSLGGLTPIPFKLYLAADHTSPATGKSPTVTIWKGGGSFVTPAGVVTEVGNGWYELTPTAVDTNTNGFLLLHATEATSDAVNDSHSVGGEPILQASTIPIPFFIAQSADHVTGLTLAAPAVQIAKGGGPFATPAGTVAEIAFGWYKLTPTAVDTSTLGAFVLYVPASANGDPVDDEYTVEAVPVAPVVAAIVAGFTRAQLIANTREVMDAVNASRWSDGAIATVLGIVHRREWSGILGANPYYRFATRSVTSASDGTIAYTALNSGAGDTTQSWSRILSITDGGQIIYRQTSFADNPLATLSAGVFQYDRLWYDAGSVIQILPVGVAPLSITVNWIPPRVDQLSADSSVGDFPDGHEALLWLEAAAMLLSKGGAENDAAQTMRAMADQERQTMYSDIQRRSARPIHFGYPDSASEWGA